MSTKLAAVAKPLCGASDPGGDVTTVRSICPGYFFLFVWPPPERDPDRRRPELPRAPFFDPVPDGPGRLPLFFFPLDPRPEVRPRPRGASGFAPCPRRDEGDRRGPPSPATSPLLSAVVRRALRVAVPRECPPRPPPP
ncbi:MAG TPA: hypothetical protein VG106_11610, partial [Vicinamibacterales bacterium]|nr:hypothetical protein [Vicinamibacterales bacterium]